MAHTIRADAAYAVVDMDGYIVETFGDQHDAERRIRNESRAYHRRPGNENNYIPRSIIQLVNGTRVVKRDGRYSTRWVAC